MSQRNSFWFKVAAVFLLLVLLVPIMTACDDDNDDDETTSATSAPLTTKTTPSDTGSPTPSSAPAAITDPIMVDGGLIAGMMLGDIGNIVRAYRGIPYADPPVGEFRWKPPQPVTPWDGIRECIQYGPWAPQSWPANGSLPGDYASEDCLYLNLYTPAEKENDRLPVMVWFHGGGLSGSSGNISFYNSLHLAQHGVVTVVVNQRLGPIGYMAHPLLSEEQGASGNYGTMDQIAAMKWVHDNIAALGGDPDNVTIFGESGGGTKVTSLLAAPAAKGLFHRAIIQSGHDTLDPDSRQPTQTEGELTGEKLMEACGATSLEEMRSLPWETIIGAGSGASLTVDGTTLPDQVSVLFETGRLNDVPLIVGANDWENTSYGGITRIGEARASYGYSNTYVYVFTHMPSNWSNQYVPHGFELSYLFGDFSGMAEWYLRFSYLKNIGHYPPNDPAWNDPGNPDAGIDESDEHVSEATASMWTHFAATGDPSVPALIKWPAYDAEDPQYLEIEDPLTVNVWDCSAFAPQCYLPVPEDLSSGGLSADSMIADLLDNPDTKAVLEKHIPDNISDPRLPLFLSLRSLFALAGPDRIDQSKLPLIEADLNKLYAD